jgi:hypothetical protein
MIIVNQGSSYPIGSQVENINGVEMRGIPEKQGLAFSAHGYRIARHNPSVNADEYGRYVRKQSRPLSALVLHTARSEYAQRKVTPFPRYFIIEPTAVCNRACPFCSILVTNRSGLMKWKTFTTLMLECGKHPVYGLSLYQLGEPFLWSASAQDGGGGQRLNIADMVDYAKLVGRFQAVNLSTNGDVNNLNCVLGRELDDLIISIDGTTAEVYHANRPSTKPNDSGAYGRTLERVHYFLAEKDGGGFDKPWVRLQIINKDNTADQVLDFVRYWIEVPGVDDVLVKNLDSMRPWLGNKIVSDEEDAVKAAALGAMPCQHLYAIGSMTADGRLNACCHDARTELTTAGANIEQMTFADWWNGEYLNGLRAAHNAGEFNAVCGPCRERDTWLG